MTTTNLRGLAKAGRKVRLKPYGHFRGNAVKAIPLWRKMDRDEIRPLFRAYVGDKIPKDQLDEYFEEAYRTINRVYRYDITPQQQARYMAKHVDTIKRMREFKQALRR